MGLSQQQLAGREMTRAFISMVESGKCLPSPTSLRIIAQRLGKTADYFLGAETVDDSLSSVLATLEEAKVQLDEPLPRLVAMETALREAIRRCGQADRPELETEARLLLLRCLGRQERYEWVLNEGEAAIARGKEAGEQLQLAAIHRTIGSAAYVLERFTIAKHSYEQAVLYYSVHKRFQGERVELLTALGDTLFRLGQIEEAATRYRSALGECNRTVDPGLWGKLALGMGRCASDAVAAEEWTREAVGALTQAESAEGIGAQHDLGRILASQGKWDQAYLIFNDCFAAYREQCALSSQAAILENLAEYWIYKDDLDQAEALCWQALEMLDSMESLLLRGRLCRLLGSIASRRGSTQEATSLLRLSIALLKSVKAHAEIERTTSDLHSLMRERSKSTARS